MAKFKVGDKVILNYSPVSDYGCEAVVIALEGNNCRVEYINKEGKKTSVLYGEDYLLLKPINVSNIISKIKQFRLKEPEKSFQKAGVKNDKGELTVEGKDAFIEFLFEKHQDEFNEKVVQPILKEEEAEAEAKK